MAKSFFKKIGNSAVANCCRWFGFTFFSDDSFDILARR